MPCRILVDADACPVRAEIARVAEKSRIETIWFANAAQGFEPDGGRMVRVSDRRDAADFSMASECRAGDIVVTDDIGLASMVLAKCAAALSSRGREFDLDQIPILLAQRHAAAKARRAGKRTRGPSALTRADRQRFQRELAALVRERRTT